MHKLFYASGFIFHPLSQQILLQQRQRKDNEPHHQWLVFSGKSKAGEDPKKTFQRLIEEQLGIKLTAKNIFPVYDYFNEELGADQFVHYAQIGTIPRKIRAKEDTLLSWFAFRQIPKLSLPLQTRQDIIVSQRVINAANRIREGDTPVTK